MTEYTIEWVNPAGWRAMLAAATLEDAVALASQGETRGNWKADKITTHSETVLHGKDLQDALAKYSVLSRLFSLERQRQAGGNTKSW